MKNLAWYRQPKASWPYEMAGLGGQGIEDAPTRAAGHLQMRQDEPGSRNVPFAHKCGVMRGKKHLQHGVKGHAKPDSVQLDTGIRHNFGVWVPLLYQPVAKP